MEDVRRYSCCWVDPWKRWGTAPDRRPPSRCQTASRLRSAPNCFLIARSSSHGKWWSQTGSNRRPPACKAGALPTELWPRQRKAGPKRLAHAHVVGPGRLELPTPRLSSVCSNQLSYGPSPAAVVRRTREAHRNWARNPSPLPGSSIEESASGREVEEEKRRRR